jgi:hypothetical protein
MMSMEAPHTRVTVHCAFLWMEIVFCLREGSILVLFRAEVTDFELAVKRPFTWV